MPTTPRFVGTVQLDSPPQAWVDELITPGVRDVFSAAMTNRRRTTRVREDTKPLVLEVRGAWIDDAGAGPRFKDFRAALLSQQQVLFDLGDGSEYRMVDVLDVMGQRLRAFQADGPGQDGDPWAYVMKVLTYEPYSRVRAPLLSAAQALANGAGAVATSWNVNYAGTAPGEPTWQVGLTVPAGVHVTQLELENNTTEEDIVIPFTAGGLTNGAFVILVDSSGSDGGATPPARPTTTAMGCWPTSHRASVPALAASTLAGRGRHRACEARSGR